MATFGGTGAEACKDGINSIFTENGPLHLPEDGYKLHVQVTVQKLILARKLG